MLVPQLVWS